MCEGSLGLRVLLPLSGETFWLPHCGPQTTARQLKEELELVAGIPLHCQRLLYLDQGVLMDESTIRFHDIVPGGIITMCIWHEDGWEDLVLAAIEGDIKKLSCLGVTEDSSYQTAHSKCLGAKEKKEWVAHRAFVAFYIAAHRNHSSVVHYFLQNGIDYMKKTPAGRTALHVASSMGNVNCVDLLLQHEELVSERDSKGQTAMSLARQWRRKQSEQKLFLFQWKKRVSSSAKSRSLQVSKDSTEFISDLRRHGDIQNHAKAFSDRLSGYTSPRDSREVLAISVMETLHLIQLRY
ncbi:LOW QUALITY PROTEIN: ankyrin repeat domain-containing protein 60 [Tachyglossus aculeatus]|uniref:LOW QUALITY PROTEIN: ankyrin repeat domain-containing protein 60 n=1 Tax=Tachyglossus aculeatus TaxID=9261 RepID=UPI0018F522FA|nr:LOW QUALITY PROTEIN: ankyrin repeat domain-containing protein 60 [Tachyglossus aculeatus]